MVMVVAHGRGGSTFRFFDVMEYLPIHLIHEARLGGPVQYKWMYSFESYFVGQWGNDVIYMRFSDWLKDYISSGDGDRGHISKGSKSSKSSRKTHRRPLDSSTASGSLSATPYTHSSLPVSYVPYGTRHPTHSSVPPFPTTSHTFMPTPDIRPPRGNSTYSSSCTPSLSGSYPHMSSLPLKDRSFELDSQGTLSTPPLTQSYRVLTPAQAPSPTPSPAPAAGEPQPGDTNSFGRVMIVPDGSGVYDRAYSSWSEIPHRIRHGIFNQFKHDKTIAMNFERKGNFRISDWFRDARLKNKRPEWMLPHLFEELQRYWSTPEFKAKCEQAKKAISKGKGGSLHTGGAKSQGTIARELDKKLGRD